MIKVTINKVKSTIKKDFNWFTFSIYDFNEACHPVDYLSGSLSV